MMIGLWGKPLETVGRRENHMYRGHNAWNATKSGTIIVVAGCTPQNGCVGVMLISEDPLEGVHIGKSV